MFSTNSMFLILMTTMVVVMDAILLYITFAFFQLGKHVFPKLQEALKGLPEGEGTATPQQLFKHMRKTFYILWIPLCLIVAGIYHTALFYIHRMQPSISRVLLGMGIVLIFSMLLFYVKVSNLKLYAVGEGLFAIIYCGVSISKMGDKFATAEFVALVSSIYLMIRAMDNYQKSRDEKKKAKEVGAPVPVTSVIATL